MSAPDRTASIVDVIELARVGGVVQGRAQLERFARLRSLLGDGPGTLTYRLEARSDAHGRAAASLSVRGELSLVCDRCGAVLRHPVEHNADYYFVEDEDQLNRLPVVVDEPEPLAGGRAFDLAALVEDEAILSLPLSPRHESCSPRAARGIEAADAGPGPFAGLQEFLRKAK